MLNKKVLSAIAIFLCLFSITLVLASCKSTTKEESWFNYSENSIYVTLDANYTTGYEWTVNIEGSCVQLKEENYTPLDAPLGMVGVGGTWTCILDAACNGDATVNFIYARPWDTTDIAQTHTLQISVSNGKLQTVQEITTN